MFEGMFVSYKSFTSIDDCIYAKYKLCVEKYEMLLYVCKQLKNKNKLMDKELKELQSHVNNTQKDIRVEVKDVACDAYVPYEPYEYEAENDTDAKDCYELV